jgi:hypothetical protein
MDGLIPQIPYIKNKGFMESLAPIARNGIPKEADSRRNKSVLGTIQHESFWLEELDKILNGVTIGGRWIPGRFYYYMNYKYMSTIRGVITPDMVDLHLEIAYYIEYCKNNGVNYLGEKGRRKGVSEAFHTMVIDYGWRFNEAYKGGVAAGKKVYVEDFISKWRFADASLPPELGIKKLTDNNDEIIAGYSIKNEYNAFVDQGSFNTIYARTMHTNPNMFKGLYLNDVISEEIGEHEKWFEFFSATKDCLMSGNKQVGSFFAFGTAGSVNKGSKDFKRISEEAAAHNFIEHMIFANRFYYFGGATEKNRQLPLNSELYKEYKAYQLIGVEDLDLSKSDILAKREKLLKEGNLKEYNEDLQNNPLSKKDMFRKTITNNFNIDKLNNQQHAIDSAEHKKYSRYILEWVRDDKGMIKTPWKVKARPATALESDEQVVYILDSEHPRQKFKNLYVAGIDSYNIDTSKTSKSLGAMCVLIRENTIVDALKKVPVAVIRTRPPRKETFYEMCLKLAVYYNLIGNVLGDIRSDGILEFWKTWGADRFLAHRPAKFESEDSGQLTDYWFSINKHSKPLMVGVMQRHIEDYSENIWFNSSVATGPNLIDELQNYDEVEIGSDNDLADAYGIALVQDISCETRPKDTEKEDQENIFDLPDFRMGKDGNVYLNDGSEDEFTQHTEGGVSL